MGFHAKADRWSADLSDPPDGQGLLDALDALDEDEDEDEVRAARRELQREIDQYSNTLRKLQMGWAKHQTMLQNLILKQTDLEDFEQ